MVGLKIRFFRDLSVQFGRSQPTDPVAPQLEEKAGDRLFNVLGSLDYMSISPLKGLAELGDSESQKLRKPEFHPFGTGVHFATAMELLLVPAQSEASGKPSPQISRALTEFNELPLLFLLRLNLSSVALDAAKGPKGVRQILNTAVQLIRDRCQGDSWLIDHLHIWHTLGGPDLVCIAAPTTNDHIRRLDQLVKLLRGAPLDDLKLPNAPECHAFSSAQATLCFHHCKQLIDIVSSSTFTKDERRSPVLTYLCRMSVGPGHEEDVANRIINKLKKSPHYDASGSGQPKTTITWGYRSVIVEVSHLYDLIMAIEAAAWQDGSFLKPPRQPEVGTLRTSISFGEPNSPFDSKSFRIVKKHDSHWIVNPDLVKTLDAIGKAINHFSHTFVGPMQGQELRQVFATFRDAFCRNDRAGAIRDLLPFFNQLANCFAEKHWTEYLPSQSRPFDREVSPDIHHLLSGLWRALRNRIEHRAEPLDPSFPNTLEYGASKIVNAYSVAAWLCWEVLFRQTSSSSGRADLYCASDHFAACVCAGSEGRVSCRELFESFRESLESDELNAAVDGGAADPTAQFSTPRKRITGRIASKSAESESQPWNSRLLLLNVSGPTLFQPELAFVLCLHEMAEFPNWITLDPVTALRKEINIWVTSAYVQLLCEELKINESDAKSNNLLFHHVQVISICNASTVSPGTGGDVDKVNCDNLPNNYVALEEAIDRVLQHADPVELLPHLHEKTRRWGTLHELQQYSEDSLAPFDKQDPSWRRKPYSKLKSPSNGFIFKLDNVFRRDLPNGTGKEHRGSKPIGVSRATLNGSLSAIRDLLNEVIPDTGMWLALDHILTASRFKRDYKQKLKDLARIYLSLLRSLAAWQTSHAGLSKSLEMLILRWALQYCGIRPRNATAASFEKYLNTKYVQNELETIDNGKPTKDVTKAFKAALAEVTSEWDKHYKSFFSEDSRIASFAKDVLRKFYVKPSKKLRIRFYKPERTTTEHVLLESFAKLWTNTRSRRVRHDEKQIQFLFDLWSKAQKLAIRNVFQATSPVAASRK